MGTLPLGGMATSGFEHRQIGLEGLRQGVVTAQDRSRGRNDQAHDEGVVGRRQLVESFAGITAEVQDLCDGDVPDLNRMRVSAGEVLTEPVGSDHRPCT